MVITIPTSTSKTSSPHLSRISCADGVVGLEDVGILSNGVVEDKRVNEDEF